MPPEKTADIFEILDEVNPLFVISSDLSHYLPYGMAQAKDTATSRHIENLNWEKIRYDDAS